MFGMRFCIGRFPKNPNYAGLTLVLKTFSALARVDEFVIACILSPTMLTPFYCVRKSKLQSVLQYVRT